MRRIDWAEAATRDLRDAQRYLSDIHPDYGARMVIEAFSAADLLLQHPAIGARIGDSRWRKWSIKRTPYLLIYRPTHDGIEIGRVRHGRSDWQKDAS